MIIRPLSAADPVDVVRRLFREYYDHLDYAPFDPHFGLDFEDWPDQFTGDRGGLLLCTDDDGALLGCVGLQRRSARTCELVRFFVRPAARNRGAGLALARTIIETARRRGYAEMSADTTPLWEAYKVFERLGFEKVTVEGPKPHPLAVHYVLPL